MQENPHKGQTKRTSLEGFHKSIMKPNEDPKIKL